MIVATAARAALPPPGCPFGSPEVSRLRRGPGSGGARLARLGESPSSSPSLPRRPLASATLLRAVGGSRAGPVGALHAGRGARLPLGAASPLSPAGRSGGVDALCSAGAVVSGPGDAHTQRQRGPFAPQIRGGQGKCGKSAHCVLLLIRHLPSSGLEGFREVVACGGLNVTRLRGIFIYLFVCYFPLSINAMEERVVWTYILKCCRGSTLSTWSSSCLSLYTGGERTAFRR